MPLDHYVSQVHLRNFGSPELDGRLRALRKADMKSIPPRTDDVCRIPNGSTNPFLNEPRAIEEFLKEVEPRYNDSVEKLRSGKIDQAAVACIAGFVSYVICCSPAGMRILVEPIQANVNAMVKLSDSRGVFSKSPGGLGQNIVTKLVDEGGTINVSVDKQFPQAFGIAGIRRHVATFGNAHWDILLNFYDFDPYFTSDYPVAIETDGSMKPVSRVVPLAPDIAIRIVPNAALQGRDPDPNLSGFSYTRHAQKRQSVLAINRLIVQCAESEVYYRDEDEWVTRFVDKNRVYWIEPFTESIAVPQGRMQHSGIRIAERPDKTNRTTA